MADSRFQMETKEPPFRRDRLKGLRNAKSLGVEEVAARAGISQGTVTKAENGPGIPGADTLAKIARALEAPMGYFFGDYPDLDPSKAANRFSYDLFARDENFSEAERERCKPALSHKDAPRTAADWVSFCEMVCLVLGPPGSHGRLELVRPKSKAKK
jgi:transcriptional regulator with XRE-family HTH domain